MTAQVPERLTYEGETLSMCTEPLEIYFRMSGVASPFEAQHTALWRGYVGTWEINEGRFYLLSLEGLLKSGKRGALGDIFPGFATRVFGHWFSGRLRAPRGKLLEYVHGGYGSTYERDLIIKINRGIVTDSWVNENGQAPQGSMPDGYRVAAWSTLGENRDC